MSKIIIGTANFDSKYGYKKNKVQLREIKKILNFIKYKSKLNYIDTANFYGNTQKILGNNMNRKINYISKIKIKKQDIKNSKNFEKKIYLILNELKIKKLYAILIHNPLILKLDKKKKIFKSLAYIQKKGHIKKLGISVYNQEEIDFVLKKFKFNIIQLPINLFDKKFNDNGTLGRLKKNGYEIHARSIFLQGLLLENILNKKFNQWSEIFEFYNFWLKVNNLKKLDVCWNYISNIKEIDRIVVGLNNLQQLKEILRIKKNIVNEIPDFMRKEESNFTNPVNWRKANV
tara:strand:- start:15203 stop:16066 length:864 start_codon:yes stop_codon:yes gene_type:complete